MLPANPDQSSRWSLSHYSLALTVVVSGMFAGSIRGTEPANAPTLTADMAQGHALWEAACQAEANCSPECVDLYYQSAVVAYACLAANPQADPKALGAYNESIGRCLRNATKHGRIDTRSHLTIQHPAGTLVVPIKHTGFVWQAQEFSYLIDPAGIKRDNTFLRYHNRCGVGAIEVVVRNPQCDAMDKYYLPKWQSFAATALLRPDLNAWLGAAKDKLPKDVLEFVDPLRVQTVELAGKQLCLAADYDAPFSQMRLLGDELGYRSGNFLTPAKFVGLAGIHMLEPYQPGKIPVVLVHGTQSGPITWNDLVNDLRMDPWFVQHFQVWHFTYPSGIPQLRSANIMRTSLQELKALIDPNCTDAALNEMVLAGHSQGGMLLKPMVTWSDDKVANAIFRVPFDKLKLTAEERETLTPLLFFEPQYYVKRVIYICTPFSGVTVPASLASRFGGLIIQEPAEGKELWDHMRQENRFKVKFAFRKLPTSAEMFVRHQPLHDTLRQLRINPCVTSHCIVGRGQKLPAISPSDRVVPKRSAQTDEAASTIFIDQKHGLVHHTPEATAEVRRILCEHLKCLGRN